MKIRVEQVNIPKTEVTIRCVDPTDKEVSSIIAALNEINRRIPVQQIDTLILLQPQNVLYCEYVNRRVFVYTSQEVFNCGLSLFQLEKEYENLFRCSKNTVVNIHQIKHLKSELHGRILVTLSNGEKILISRHYASALRKRLKER